MFPSQCTGCAAVSSVWRDSSQRDTPLCAGLRFLSQSSIFGQNPKIWCHEFNDLQTSKLSKKQLCDRTTGLVYDATTPADQNAVRVLGAGPGTCAAGRPVGISRGM